MSSEWFQEMGILYSLLPDYETAYARLGRIFFELLDDATSESDVLLAGCFAKTDYLLKQKSAKPQLRRMVNGMRLRLTKDKGTQSAGNFMYDFQALCLFIALLLGKEVPAELEELFPKERQSGGIYAVDADYIRVILHDWDDEFLHCTSESGEEDIRIRYSGEGQLYGHDNSYLSELLCKGMMLNVVRPRKSEDGVLLPELLVLEPDFLVDVSTIASCFESYAESPVVSLLRRLEPPAITEPILMGNMASELLDTVIHDRGSVAGRSSEMMKDLYVEAAKRFFQSNAVGVMYAHPDKSFHSLAWQQMQNIHKALHATLPEAVDRYDETNVVVEPTFFSEMLGLQGRMDMLQTDMRVLVEQKAGKAAYVYGDADADTPKYKEQHYIQMLLYMAIIRYNFRQLYETNNRELHAFLLYSKYMHPLVGLGFAPELLHRAIVLRNRYVAQERDLCQGGISKLMSSTAESLNLNEVRGRLWEQYQRPRIEGLLCRFRLSSELERAYFQRFYRFVALEHRLSKIGNQTKECSGFASAWLSSLDEKQQYGNILLGLAINAGRFPDTGHISHLVLEYSGESGNFRQGDIVVLYSYPEDHAPDIRRTMVFRAVISNVSPSEITLKLRNTQKDASVFHCPTGSAWCLEHDFMESSYSGLYKGLYSFLCAPQERKDLVLMQRSPRVNPDVSLRGDYGGFNGLQKRIKASRDLFLVIGPPGTGKTSFGMLHTLQEELLEGDTRVLVVSYTNRSVDEICSKLYPEIDFIRLGGNVSSVETYSERYLGSIVAECKTSAELRDRVAAARVVVGTTSSAMSHLPLLSMDRYSLCIIDEASQILEPHLLPLLSLCCADGTPCISRFVMIGDHKQLPAVVQQRSRESRVDDPSLNAIGLSDCRNSMFERLLTRYRHNPEVCYMLTRQGRMHRDIAHFPNIAFYGGKLQEVPLEHQLAASAHSRVRFIDVQPQDYSQTDKVNPSEAFVIADELMLIWQRHQHEFKPEETVGVIVPYRNQISAIRTVLAERLDTPDHPLLHITIDTVERYQGSQRNYIIYGFTVQKVYQLRFLTETTFQEDGMTIDRKLNVAMTRAREYLILVGNSPLLSRVPLYKRLLHYCG
ncbi:MAG: DNA2/NAM7 family helicase [Bacteroidaceae bacterium]|nr:DNA2/NAM7 family helicase [Bacteroidaceae bacterium]